MMADDAGDCQPAKAMVTFEIDHRPSAREIERMMLEEFNVPKAMRPEVAKMAMRISHYAADHFLEMAKLMRGHPQGSA